LRTADFHVWHDIFIIPHVNIDILYNNICNHFTDTPAKKELNVISGPTAPRNQLALVGVMFMTWGIVFLDRMTQLYLAPYIVPDLHLSGMQIGMVTSVTAVTWAISAPVFGAVSDRVGRKSVLLPMMLAFSTLCCLAGAARGFWDLFALRSLMGIAGGPCWSVVAAQVEEASEPRHRGRNVGIVVSAGALVGLFIGPILATQVAATIGWRASFVVAGSPGFVAALLVWRLVRDPAKDVRAAATAGWGSIGVLLRSRNVWLCCLGSASYIGWLMLQNLFAGLYIVNVVHQPATTAGFLLSAAGIGNLFVGYVSIYLVDRLGRRSMLAALSLLSLLSPVVLQILPMYRHPSLLASALFLTQGGIGIAPLVMVLIPAESVPPHVAGAAIGLVNFFGELVGGALLPTIAGRLSETIGLYAPLWMAICAMATLFVVSLLVRDPQRLPTAEIRPP
jgi:predicted MFS family arabinose efflux permease